MPGSDAPLPARECAWRFLFTLIASVYLIKTLAIVFSKNSAARCTILQYLSPGIPPGSSSPSRWPSQQPPWPCLSQPSA